MTESDQTPNPPQYLSQDQEMDTLEQRGTGDPLDEGLSPAEKWSPGEGFGTTADEQREGESFEQRESQMVPEPDPYTEPAPAEKIDDGEVGSARAGRLVDPDAGIGEDTEKDLVGDDVGLDDASSTAEEAAMHIVDEE